ncbi:MAG: DUF72 domain-containing protein, partial [Anaerolineales bacterium]|nr:DUF72 domain-containing protein [Anaerolineales bacterium]
KLAFCNIDQPNIKTNIAATEIVTSQISYLRFHGRNAAQWFTTANEDSEPVEFNDWAGDWPEPREMSIDFDAQVPIDYLEIEVENSRDQEPAHVHLWEVWLR